MHLLNGVRSELIYKIEEEARNTRAAVETVIINQHGRGEGKVPAARTYRTAESPGKSLAGNMVVILVFLFVIGVGGPGVYFYFNKPNERKHEMVLPQPSIYVSHQNSSDSQEGVSNER